MLTDPLTMLATTAGRGSEPARGPEAEGPSRSVRGRSRLRERRARRPIAGVRTSTRRKGPASRSRAATRAEHGSRARRPGVESTALDAFGPHRALSGPLSAKRGHPIERMIFLRIAGASPGLTRWHARCDEGHYELFTPVSRFVDRAPSRARVHRCERARRERATCRRGGDRRARSGPTAGARRGDRAAAVAGAFLDPGVLVVAARRARLGRRALGARARRVRMGSCAVGSRGAEVEARAGALAPEVAKHGTLSSTCSRPRPTIR